MPKNIDPYCEVLARQSYKLVVPDPTVRRHLMDEYQGCPTAMHFINARTSTQFYGRHTITAMPEPSWQIIPHGNFVR
jgi:hypothetical protein